MGEARTRRLALERRQPLPQDLHRCPACLGRRTTVELAPALGLSHVPTRLGVCADCRAIWEAFPEDWRHDAVEAAPCDNCAFAKGSPEAADKEGWLALLAELRGGREFRCHKGAPILIDDAAGTIAFDEAWVQRHGRTCAGFLRAMQQWPDWLENRYPELKAAHDAEAGDDG